MKRQEERLQQLYAEKENSQKAFSQKELYERIVDFLEARWDYDRLKQQFQAYPGIMEKLFGDELDRVRELENEISDANQAISKSREDIDR